MDNQTLINAAFGVIGFLGAYVLRSVTDNVKSLQTADTNLADKVQHIEILVAGHYVKRDDLDKLSGALFAKLDRIETKLDTKVDK